MRRHTTCGVLTPQVPIVTKCPLGAIIPQSIRFPCTREECRLLHCQQAKHHPCRPIHHPRGLSPVGVSHRHKWPRSAHARRTTDPHPPSGGQSPCGVSPRWGSVAVTNVHARPTPNQSSPDGANRVVWSVRGWGQSPSQMCTLSACAAHARPPPAGWGQSPGGVSPRWGSVAVTNVHGASGRTFVTAFAVFLALRGGRRPARDRRTCIGSGAHNAVDADS